MATQTTYYGFNKPQGTDPVNPLVDTNPNWDIADATLHDLNVRSAANTTEVVSLGVHALSTLNTDATILKWIATANFTAGDTFTLNGVAIAAATPSGEALKTNAYVAGAVVIAALNSDSTAMTIYVTGTTVASDAERLGGELPSYYATDSDMDNAKNDITDLQNLMGNTSIVGIGDGTVTGAIDSFKSGKAAASWTQIGYATGGAKVTIPQNTYHEILMILNASDGSSYSFIYPIEMLFADTWPTSGGYAVGASYLVNLKYTHSSKEVSVDRVIVSGTDMTLNSSLYVFGR